MPKDNLNIDVMLSSTTKDLPKHRERGTQGILRSGMRPLIMESLTASVRNPKQVSLKLVDEAEIYVGVFGMRYGYIPEDAEDNPEGISITEMEYRHAMATGKVVLIFMMSDDHPGPQTAAEGQNFYEQSAEGKEKLKALKDELTKKHTVAFFTSPDDLLGYILQALKDDEVIARAKAIAELTAGPITPPESPLPEPPEFYADPPYTLTTEFIGRSAELARLDAWAAGDDPLMLVEAIGGMGKSAVTWEWVQRRLRDGHDFDGVLWWSFYESGATMAAFVRHALAYITRQDPDALKGGSLRENFKALHLALSKGRYLLALDGLERTLVAYHRWDAAQMRDDTVEAAESIIKERDIRACTDPKDDDVLRGLLACANSKVLISSRLLPLALEDRTGSLSRGVDHLHLNGLATADALALVRAAGVTVRDERQFGAFIDRFGGHSLLVKLVAGRVNRYRRGRGDFDAWHAAEGRQLTISDFDLRQTQTHILEYALADLSPQALRFLSQIAAFGDAVAYDTLTVFNPFVRAAPEPVNKPDHWFEKRRLENADDEDEKQRWQAEIDAANARYEAYLQAQAEHDAYLKSNDYRQALAQFDALLTELEERGLLRWERAKDTYDMHPVVRGTAFDRLEADDRAPTFERIRGHFEQRTEDIEAAREVADLTNTIGVYRALLGAGKWDEAAGFFVNRLMSKLCENIAAYYTVIELLTPLFADGTDALPRLEDKSLQGAITTTLANMFYHIGRTAEALTLEGLLLRLDLDRDDSASLIIDLLNYATSLQNDNQLALAVRARQTALALAEATDNQRQITFSTLYLLSIYGYTGQWQQAEAAYAALQDQPPREVFWQSAVEHWYAETLIYRGLDATDALDKAEKLSHQSNRALGIRQIRGWRGEVALRAGDYETAMGYFEEDIALRRQAGSSDVVNALGRLARAYAHKGDHVRAREIIETNIFEKLYTIYAAEVYHLTGDADRACEYARKAYHSAWADGPPYAWWWNLERAKAVLDALGEPYPALPPFDAAQVGKFELQDEIEAYIEQKRAGRKKDKE